MADDFRVAGGYVEVVARVNERTGRDAAERVTRDVERELAGNAPAFEGAGGRAGDAIGRGAVRSVEGRLRDEHGRFVAAGEQVGAGLSEGIEREVDKGVTRVREKVTKSGEDSGKGFFSKFADAFKGGGGSFISTLTLGWAGPGLSSAFSASPIAASIGMALAAAIIAVAAPAIGAGIVAALGVGSGLGVIIAGAILAFKRDPMVKAAGADLGKTIMGVDTQPLQDAYDAAQAKLTAALASHSKTRIAQAEHEAAATKKALTDAQNFNDKNASLPDLARGAFAVPLTAAIGQVKRAFIELTPTIKQIFDAVGPSIGPLTDGFIGLVKNALPGFLDFLKSSGPTLDVFAKNLPLLGTALSEMFKAFGQGGPGAAAFLGDFIGWIAGTLVFLAHLVSWLSMGYKAIRDFFTSIPGWAKAAGDWLDKTWGKVTGFASGIWKSVTSSVSKGTDETLGWFSKLPGRVGGALAKLPRIVIDQIWGAAQGMAYLAGWGVGQFVSWVGQLPGRAWNVLSKLPGVLGDLFTWAWNTAIAVIKFQIGLAIAEAKAVPGLIWGALVGLGHLLGNLWDAAWGAAVGAVKFQIGVIIWEVKKLPGILWNLGGDIIGGLINGIGQYYSKLWDLAWNLGQHFLKGFKAVFGIHSPSKVMDEEIVQAGIGAGLVQGLDKTRKQVGVAAGRVADAVMSPFGIVDQKPTAPAGASGPAGANGSFGPYIIQIGDKEFATLVIDAVTGAPREVASTVDRGRTSGGGFGNTARRRP